LRSALALLTTALAVALPPAPAAQESDPENEDNWYRVELLVFANRDPEAAASERWPLLPTLAYPARWLPLETGSARIAADREYRLVTVEDSVPPPPIDLFWDRSIAALWREYRRQQMLREPAVRLESLTSVDESTLDVPRQRVLLPADTRELDSQRRRIDSSAGLDVLFHQSWLQRMRDKNSSLPLIMDGPIQFGDYPELQGSILLYSGRYLHIATDVWLNTGGGYLDDDPTSAGWRMPSPPLPVKQAPLQPFVVEIGADWFAGLEQSGPEPAGEPEPAPQGPWPEAAAGDSGSEHAGTGPELLSVADELSGADAAAGDAATDDGEATLAEPELVETPRTHQPVSAAELAAFLEQPLHDYEFRHAVRVQQQRRMRSGELHYIDHPLLGIVVKINRYEFEPFISDPELTAETR
jgi:hypothetical protein